MGRVRSGRAAPLSGEGRRNALRVVALVVAVALAWHYGHDLSGMLKELDRHLAGLGAFAPLAFVVAMTLTTPLFVPEAFWLLSIGIAFDPWIGIPTAFAGVLGGAVAIHLIVHRWREPVMRFAQARYPRLASAGSVLAGADFSLLFWLRVPPLPFALLSVVLASAGVRLRPYVAACLGRLPEVVTTVFVSHSLRHVADASSAGSHATWSSHLPVFVTAVLSIVATFALAQRARRELERAGVDLSSWTRRAEGGPPTPS